MVLNRDTNYWSIFFDKARAYLFITSLVSSLCVSLSANAESNFIAESENVILFNFSKQDFPEREFSDRVATSSFHMKSTSGKEFLEDYIYASIYLDALNSEDKQEIDKHNIFMVIYRKLSKAPWIKNKSFLKDFVKNFGPFKDSQNIVEADGSLSSNLGDAYYILFKSNERSCVAIYINIKDVVKIQETHKITDLVYGLLCLKPGAEKVTDGIAKNFTRSIGIKGTATPELKTFYLASRNEILPVEKAKVNKLADRLREIKDLYEQKLITEEEYKEAKKALLGLK